MASSEILARQAPTMLQGRKMEDLYQTSVSDLLLLSKQSFFLVMGERDGE